MFIHHFAPRFVFASLFFVACCVGCSTETEEVALAPASGIVTLKGKPLAGYEIYFSPVGGGRRAYGTTDEVGKFTLQYAGAKEGAPAGEYVVYLGKTLDEVAAEPGREEMEMLDDKKLPFSRKYLDPKSSGISVALTEQGNTDIRIEI